jgi:DNA-binding transcriptional MocR family regulator
MPPKKSNIQSARDLEQFIETQIMDGTLRPGSRLETIRTASERFGLSPTTTAAAYRRLTDRGLVVPMGRQGTFVADGAGFSPHIESEVPNHLIDLASGNPDSAFLPDLAGYLGAAVSSAQGFGAPAADPRLEEAAISRLVNDGINTDRIVVTSGALDAVERALEAHLRPSAAVAIEDPGYPWLRSLVAALGLRAVPVTVDDAGMVPGALEAVIRGVQAVISTPRAQNPFGSTRTEQRARELRAVIKPMPDILVIEDDYLALNEPSPLHLITTDRHAWLIVQSVTKTLGADLRVAWSAGDSLTLDRIQGRQQVGPGWVSRILQRAVALILSDGEAMARVADSADAYRVRREALINELDDLGITAHGVSGMNVWIPVHDEAAVVATAARAGFAIRPGQRYRQNSVPSVRVTVSDLQLEDTPKLAAALGARDLERSRASRHG